eukprot:9479082-Pyramimonas_sp.AAC.1
MYLHWVKQERVVVMSHSGVIDRIVCRKSKNCELVEHLLDMSAPVAKTKRLSDVVQAEDVPDM